MSGDIEIGCDRKRTEVAKSSDIMHKGERESREIEKHRVTLEIGRKEGREMRGELRHLNLATPCTRNGLRKRAAT